MMIAIVLLSIALIIASIIIAEQHKKLKSYEKKLRYTTFQFDD